MDTTEVQNGYMLIEGSTTNYPEAQYQITGLDIGQAYIIEFDMFPVVGTYCGMKINDGASDIISYGSSSGASFIGERFEVVANGSIIALKPGIRSSTNNIDMGIDNISVYKLNSTLDTALTTPISFIDDKPYQVASGTPMDRLVDYPSIPKNVIESSYVDGDLEVSGEVKGKTINVSNLPTVDPFIAGELWNSSNTIKLSMGV